MTTLSSQNNFLAKETNSADASREVSPSSNPANAGSEMQIVSTCSIDYKDFEMNTSEEEEREDQEQNTDSDSEAANSSSMTAKTEMTKYKKESNDPQDKDILLKADNTDYLNVFGLENTDEVVCPPSALGILLEDLVQRFESNENIPTYELLTIIDKIIQTEVE